MGWALRLLQVAVLGAASAALLVLYVGVWPRLALLQSPPPSFEAALGAVGHDTLRSAAQVPAAPPHRGAGSG